MARALVGDDAHSEDLVQSAYLAALQHRPAQLSPAWLKRVVRNGAFDALRARRRKAGAERDWFDASQPLSCICDGAHQPGAPLV